MTVARALAARASQRARPGRSRSGSASQQVQRASARRRPAAAAIPRRRGRRPSTALRPGPALGSTPASRRPRPLAAPGPRAGRRRRGRQAQARGDRQQRRRRAGSRSSRSPQRITTSSPPSRSSAASVRRAASAPPRRAVAAPARRPARAQRDEQRLAAGREAQRRARRWRPATTAARGDRELDAVAAHALADAQVEDRRVVDGLAVEHQHGVGELEVGDGRLQRRVARARAAARAAGAPPARESMCGEPSASRIRRCEQEALLVGRRRRRRARRRAPRRARSARGGLVERPLPRDRAQLAAVAHQRLGDRAPRRGWPGRRSGPCRTASRRRPRRGRARARAARARRGPCRSTLHCAGHSVQTRARALDVPRPRAEAVGPRGQRAHRAQLDDVAAERRDVGVPVERADERVRAALEQDQLVVLGDLLREAHAAVAEDAALAVDRDQRRELERLDEVALGLDEARACRRPSRR